MRKVKTKNDCSNCMVGDLNKHTYVAGCPFYNPGDDVHCRVWEPLIPEDEKAPKITSEKSKTKEQKSVK